MIRPIATPTRESQLGPGTSEVDQLGDRIAELAAQSLYVAGVIDEPPVARAHASPDQREHGGEGEGRDVAGGEEANPSLGKSTSNPKKSLMSTSKSLQGLVSATSSHLSVEHIEGKNQNIESVAEHLFS